MGRTPRIFDNTSFTLSLVSTAPRGAEALRPLSALESSRAVREQPAHGGSAAEQIPNSDKEVDALLQATEPTGAGLLRATLDHLRRENAALRAMLTQIQQELIGARLRERDARYLAFHDDLTALPNRRFFRERLGCALRDQGSGPPELAVIYLDLDGFKALNDAYGHPTGDSLLNLIATRLAHALRAEDLVSRLGGDEYACLIAGVTSPERLQNIASSLFGAVAAPFKIGSLVLNIRPSIGIAVCPLDGTTTDALMKAADAAMYAAKRKQSAFSFSGRSHALPHLSIATPP